MDGFSKTPEPPYYAVIFSSTLGDNGDGYDAMAKALVELAHQQPGYLGIETTRGTDNLGITVSYWQDEASILAWKQQTQHLLAQKNGIEKWYTHYELRVAKVERAYSGPAGRTI
ncbi:MAG: antibiotic biosynthesis monooxygenase [Pseudomonadota bacterium]